MVDVSKNASGGDEAGTNHRIGARHDPYGSRLTTSPLLELQHITFGYDQQTLLCDVSLHIARGEMVGLLGPNGSGKTTLLRLISGVLQPQQGQVVLEGRTLRQWGRRRVAQRIAVVPQELHMPFDFTVEQMVELGRTPFVNAFWGSRSAQDRLLVRESMQATGVESFATRVFHELSGGERQRVTLAMALAQQPALLLLDEPTAHLDIKYQVEILELAQQLNRERGVTIVAAMHDLNLAARYFPRLLLFQREVVADAGPAMVLEPGLLSRVYGIQVQVGILRGAEHLSVLPPERAEEVKGGRGCRDSTLCSSNSYNGLSPSSSYADLSSPIHPMVHVIAGGGAGEMLMRALADVAIPFVAGALNIGDSDHTLALRLASKVITEQPFAPISSVALKQVRDSLAYVRILVLCPTAIGPGNLALIEEAIPAAQRGLSVIVLNTSDLAARDYTGGKGIECMETLLQSGAIVANSVSEALELIKQYLGAYAVLLSKQLVDEQ
jgi:iron complex transport system ATP-binding protein